MNIQELLEDRKRQLDVAIKEITRLTNGIEEHNRAKLTMYGLQYTLMAEISHIQETIRLLGDENGGK